ncbi:hypothetical protein ACHAXT_011020 [Thalassiosira profunda]
MMSSSSRNMMSSMDEMDATEAMALKGASRGRRRSSRSLSRGGSARRSMGEKDAGGMEPAEYSLADLRSMQLDELQAVMLHAGVPSEDMSKTVNARAGIGEDAQKNLLVALFVNSGRVKLVAKPAAERKATTVSSIAVERHASSGKTDYMRKQSGAGASDAASTKSSGNRRKSKLEKIAEMKTECAKMKRENKSLKKTVKKLLGQLADAVKEKDQLQKGRADETSVDVSDVSKEDAKRSLDEANVLDVSELSPAESDETLAKTLAVLKKKLKQEREDHQSTKFRLQAEVDILLSKECEGLQRELAGALESLDRMKKHARSNKESASHLKHKYRGASKKVGQLTAEAEARDKLIETFSQILLQRVGLEGADIGAEEEKVDVVGEDGIDVVKVEDSPGAIKVP